MNKTGNVGGIRGIEWQRLMRWPRRQKVKDEGEDEVNKDEENRSNNLHQKSKIK